MLRRAGARTAAGAFQALALEGEAGIGKSHLLGSVLAAARADGFALLAGRCDEFASRWPFHGVADALSSDTLPASARAEASAIVSVMRGGGQRTLLGGSSAVGDQALVERTLELVESLAVVRPVLVALDDVQWADPSTLVLLSALARRLRHHPLLVVVALRLDPRAPEVQRTLDALSAEGLQRLRLSPLDEDDVAAVAADLLGATPSASLRTALGGAGGNPFFVIELIKALVDDQAITVEGDRATSVELTMPPSLQLTVMSRLAPLPARTVEAIRWAAVLGTRFSADQLCAAMDLELTRLLAVLEPAFRAGIVRDADHELRFAHDLVRQAVYQDLPAAFRQMLHAQVAEVLVTAGRPVLEIFEHLTLGAKVGDEATVRWLEQAAERSMPATAVRLLQRAVDLVAGDARRRRSLQVRLVDALVAAGNLPEAETLAHAVLQERADEETMRRARAGFGRALFHGGAFERCIGPLLEASAGWSDDIQRARHLGFAALASTFVDRDDAEQRIDEAREAAEAAGDDAAGTYAATAQAERLRMHGYLGASAVASRRAGELARRVWADPQLPGVPVPASHLLAAGFLDEAETVLRSGYWSDTEVAASMQPIRHNLLALSAYIRGDWDRAVTDAETAVLLCEEVGTRWGADGARMVLGRLAVHRNQTADAEALAATFQRREHLDTASVEAAVLEMRSDTVALQELLDEIRPLLGQPAAVADGTFAVRDLLRLYLAAGDIETARTIADAVEEVAVRARVPWMCAQAQYVRGTVEQDAEKLDAALRGYRAAGMTPAVAQASEATGLCLVQREPSDRKGLDALRCASELFDHLGAVRDVARVDRELRRLGVATPRRASRSRGAAHPALTKSEARVAALIREGLTYREIAGVLYLSKRTVETHAAHIFTKLGLSGRRELERQGRSTSA